MISNNLSSDETHSSVKDYYSRVLQTKSDLKTSACCCSDSMPAYVRPILDLIEPEICNKFYGCGAPFSNALDGLTVLDLGCGTGRDAYLLSKLVGEKGKVIGLDMTESQLATARKYQSSQAKKFGYAGSNVEFKQGYIEELNAAGLEDSSIDLVTSNCVFNLSPNKPQLFREIFRVLKPGGELIFSDVFASRRLPIEFARDPVMLGECLGNALYVEDFRRLLLELGIRDYRLLAQRQLALTSPDIEAKVGLIKFYSLTVRVFKLDLEDRCEDFGQALRYRGTIKESPNCFRLDDHHLFECGQLVRVCGNTIKMISETRFAQHFDLIGNTECHYGKFEACQMQTSQTELMACC